MNEIINSDYYNNTIPNDSVDLLLVDPPYGINYKEWDKIDFIEFTRNWLREGFRILKPAGTMWSFMAFENIFDFVPLMREFGHVNLRNSVVWARSKGRGSSKHLKSLREEIFHCTKDKNEFKWNNLKMLREVVCPYMKDGKPRGWFLDENGKRWRWTGLGNVWTYTAPMHNSKLDKLIHPSQKPTMMLERLIRLSTEPGDLVVDFFGGSGSTAQAAIASGRNYIVFEKNKEYYDLAKSRIDDFVRQGNLCFN